MTDGTPGGRPATEVLAACRDLVGPAVRAAVDTLPPSIRQVAGYHLGWWDAGGIPESRPACGGKALRPALVLLAAEAAGGSVHNAVAGAAAVELAHNFSLLHDDVMDRDGKRRHRAAAWQVYGAGAAILAGDALLALAFDVLAASGRAGAASVRILAATVQDLVDGQSADLAFERRTDVDLTECLVMARRKTGALFGCACAVGALGAGGDAEPVRRLHAFGERLGLAFQLVDDLRGIWGDPAVTGKPRCGDLRNGKKTLPVVAALTSGTPAGLQLAELYLNPAGRPLPDGELARAADLVEAAGGRSWCHATVNEQLAMALRELHAAGAPPRTAAELGALARLITDRHN